MFRSSIRWVLSLNWLSQKWGQVQVIFTGVVDDVPRKMIDIFDAFALPSAYEGLGIVLLEAQAAGLHCVISDRVPEEAILDRSTVNIVSLQDHDAWCEAVVKALNRPRPHRPGFAAMLGGPSDISTSLAALEETYDRFLKQHLSTRGQPADLA